MQYGEFANLYDILMSDVDYDAWAQYIQSFLPYGCSVCECACGTGEITWRLKKEGFNITASDISEEMLFVASQKCRGMGLQIPFVRMDMRNLSLHKPTDAVICCCDGVNYLTSDEDFPLFAESAYKSLKGGGLLLFDISSEYKLSQVLGMNTFSYDSPACTYIWRNMYDEKSRLCEMNLTFFVKSGKGYDRFDERHLQRAYSVDEIKNALEKAGFCSVEYYGYLTKKAPTAHEERIQFAALKPQ